MNQEHALGAHEKRFTTELLRSRCEGRRAGERRAVPVLLAMLTLITGSASAQLSNLGQDWSDAANPSGVWTLNKNSAESFAINQADYYSDGSQQKAWADQLYNLAAHVPFWMKVTAESHATAEAQLGDILLHGAETDRTGSSTTGVVYTAPQAGEVVIAGEVWSVNTLGRTMRWDLLVNGVGISGGTLVSNGTTTRAAPDDLADGEGGAEPLIRKVASGDQIELRFTSVPADLGDTVGVAFRITLEPDPTPTPSPTVTPYNGRPFGDLDDSGCTDLDDFLLLLDFWQLDYNGAPVVLEDFLSLLDYWQQGPVCD